MQIPTEIETLCASFGELLSQYKAVQEYQNAQRRLQADAEAQQLLNAFIQTHQLLTAKQRQGKHISEEEVLDYNQMRFNVQTHALVSERDAALADVRSLFVNLGVEISMLLGIDFPNLAALGNTQQPVEKGETK